jgi:hypothetical protein
VTHLRQDCHWNVIGEELRERSPYYLAATGSNTTRNDKNGWLAHRGHPYLSFYSQLCASGTHGVSKENHFVPLPSGTFPERLSNLSIDRVSRD